MSWRSTKFKVCLKCNRWNSANRIICQNCGNREQFRASSADEIHDYKQMLAETELGWRAK